MAARANTDTRTSLCFLDEESVGFLPCRVKEKEVIAVARSADAQEVMGFLRVEEDFLAISQGAIEEVAAGFHDPHHRDTEGTEKKLFRHDVRLGLLNFFDDKARQIRESGGCRFGGKQVTDKSRADYEHEHEGRYPT